MASIIKESDGHRRIEFNFPGQPRKKIRLGKASQRFAEGIKIRVEQLVQAKIWKQPLEGELAEWVDGLELELAKKLARVELIPEPEAKAAVKLGPFLIAHIDARTDLKAATKIVRGQVIRDLNEFFGENREVQTILPGDADDFKQSLLSRKLAPTTIHKRLQVARSFFHAMCRRKLITENPFEGVKAAATGIKERQRFVTQQEISLVLAACPNHHWKMIVALARYGGLRCPSEVLSLRWQDVDWESGRIIVTSPKTEHHADKASRTIPMFPQLRKQLEEAFELAEDGAVYVVDEKMRTSSLGPGGWRNCNLRTTFEKIIKRAGLTPWPRLFHNLRASRETELVEKYPLQVVTSWLGNTPKVAMRHYLMTTDAHFQAAIECEESQSENGVVQAARNAARQLHASSRTKSQTTKKAQEKTPDLPGCATSCDTVQKFRMAGAGFEPTTSRL